MGSLGLNSLKAIQVIVKLEDTYGISFEDEDLFFDKINTLEKIINTLGKYVKE
ncbi:acyl carrier protein [Acetivibrio straminisolvens]|uniref:acyl carrier protein n=1 Tax=Acetivibrio straminisolvens TaxID=253314 RepID=UPI000B90D6A0|nr:acyl carrier protein [Acetivibrio straminisolvens]